MKPSFTLPLLLLMTGFLSVLAISFPVLIVIGLISLIVPGLILAFAPTIFAYLCIFSLGYYSLLRRGQLAACLGGALLALAAGALPALWVNHQTNAVVKALEHKDRQPVEGIALPAAITIMQPAFAKRNNGIEDSETSCDDLCLTLLYSGMARHVTMAATPAQGRPIGGRPAVRYSIDKRTACPDIRLVPASRWPGWPSDLPFASIMQTVRIRISAGECLIANPVTVRHDDFLIVRQDEKLGARPGDLKLAPSQVSVRSLELRNNGKIISRASDVRSEMLAVPLSATPSGVGMSLDHWEWSRRNPPKETVGEMKWLQRMTGWKPALKSAGLKGDALDMKLVDRIDIMLSNKSLLVGAISDGLIEDYYATLRSKGADRIDTKRLAAIIKDERFGQFWFVPVRAIKADDPNLPALRDAISVRMRKDRDDREIRRALGSLLENMPDAKSDGHRRD
jgi:hypothetical protein